MVCCFAPGCSHRWTDGCSFYRFPTDARKRRLWIRALRRADKKPSVHSRICGCHFDSGKKKVPVLFVVGYNPKDHEDHPYCLSKEKTDGKKTGPPAMDEKEDEGPTQLIRDKEEEDPLSQANEECHQP